MKNRLEQILQYKTGGKQVTFAKMLGWTPQYLKKLLNGGNFGLQPVITLLTTFPEIDARWLLLGQGTMLSADTYTNIRQEVHSGIQSILELEKYIPYMSPEELHTFEQAVVVGNKPVFSPDTLLRWRERANIHKEELDLKFAEANIKSDKLCKQRKV